MKACVLGFGYIGQPLGILMAEKGIDVVGFDKNTDLIKDFNAGISSICEPGLDDILIPLLKKGKIWASATISVSDVYFICVPTPINMNKSSNLSIVNQSIEELSTFLKKGDIIIIESTCPVGTTEKITRS